jgi:preprotein translocase subunit SecD
VPRSQKTSALILIAAAVLGMLYTELAGNRPLLGLDLQGGVSVVLQPTRPAEDESLDQAIQIIRNRVDALGVAEPEISRQGNNIVVDLPGVQEQQRALDLVGQTAELRFRPVLATLAPPAPGGGSSTTVPGDPTATTVPSDPGATAVPADPSATTTPADPSATTAPPTTAPPSPLPADPSATTAPAPSTGGEQSLAPSGIGGRWSVGLRAQGTEGTATTVAPPPGETTVPTETTVPAAGESTTTIAGAPAAPDGSAPPVPADGSAPPVPADGSAPPAQGDPAIQACFANGAVPTAPEDDRAENSVLLPDDSGSLYCLGPTLLTGDAIETATALPLGVGEWQVNPVFESGADGIDRFNQAAKSCFDGDAQVCPTRALAIVLDHQVIVAPQINAAAFQRDQIQITGGFTEREAKDVATVLRYGALPVELEAQQTRTVSATIGDDAFRAGVIAGIVGLAAVGVYLLAYYRLAGLVVVGGLAISGMLLWTIISWFGESQGLALTMAGIVGIIVSIGVAADSNIVYFENVRDAVREGRSVRTSVERAYRTSISTIVKADVVSLIAAGLLYWLTVGAVRGFAFYLGLATLLDLVVAWFFMRPGLNWLATGPVGRNSPSRLGLPVGPASGGAS